jgi:hypothetical protein
MVSSKAFLRLSRQNENVLLEQSRNVLLTDAGGWQPKDSY